MCVFVHMCAHAKDGSQGLKYSEFYGNSVWTSRMSQRVVVPAAKLKYLGLIPWTHM